MMMVKTLKVSRAITTLLCRTTLLPMTSINRENL